MVQFGVTILIGFTIIGAVFAVTGRFLIGAAMGGAAGAVCVLSILAPRAARPIYWLWMGMGFVMGTIMSRLILLAIFYAVLTPLAMVFRLMKRDALGLKKPSTPTYWKPHPKISDPTAYDHLF